MFGQSIVSKTVQEVNEIVNFSESEIVNFSESEIYTTLVECGMNANTAVIKLLSQDTFQEVKSKRSKKREAKDQAESSRRGIPYRGARNSAKDSDNTARGGGNKFNSNETRLSQSVSANRRGNHWAGSSSAPAVRPPPNSDPKNAEVKKAAPTGSTGAATSFSLPVPAYQFAWVSANPRKKTMAEIVKMGKPLHQKKVIVPRSSETQESGSKAPLKDEGSSTEKQDVSSLLKPSAGSKTDQVSESQLVDDQSRPSETQEGGNKSPLKHEGSSLEKQGVTEPEPKTLAEQASKPQHVDKVPERKTNPVTFHPDVDQLVQCSQLRFGSFGSRIGSGQPSSRFIDNLEDTQETEEDSSSRHLYNNFDREAKVEEELGDNAATDEQASYQIDSTSRNDHASSDSETQAARHVEPPQEDPQMHNLESFFRHVMALSDASISPPGAGQQAAAALYQYHALNAYYHQHGMPLGNHGNNFISDAFMPNGYMHSGFQQGFSVGNYQSPLVVILPPSAQLQQQNENMNEWYQVHRPFLRAAPRGGVYIYSVPPNQQSPGFVQAQQLYQQQLSLQAAMSLDQPHHHQHHHQHQRQYHHHQQSAGDASSQTREQLWPNNN